MAAAHAAAGIVTRPGLPGVARTTGGMKLMSLPKPRAGLGF